VTAGKTGAIAPILVVDDDAGARELVAAHLEGEGFDTRHAASGAAALRIVAEEAVSLVILDMRMPGLSGMDVIRALRATPGTATVPIMVLTGRGDDYPLAASLGIGADDYLTKPIRLDELASLVRARLRGRRVAAEHAQHASEELYRTLTEHSADGILVSDRTGRYVEANQAICAMLGYSRAELLAMFTPSLSAADDPLSPVQMDERLAETQDGAGLLVERRYRCKDGRSLPVEVGFSQLPDGRLQRNVRDITARLAAEEERTRLARALDQTADAVWMKDAEGSIVTYINHAFRELYGYEFNEIVGQFAGILHSGRHEHAYFDALCAEVASGKTWKGSILNRCKDGTIVEVEAVVSGIRDADGRLVGFMQTDRDVTRERALEGELRRRAEEREVVEAALTRIDPGSPPEVIAADACAEIMALPSVETVVVIALHPEGGGTVLGVAGRAAPAFASNREIPGARAEHLLAHATDGIWTEHCHVRPDDGAYGELLAATGLREVAYAPMRGPSGLVGVVALGIHDGARQAFLEQLPVLTTLASMLGSLLSPGLETRMRANDARSAIRAILDAKAFTPFFQPIVEIRSGAVVGYEALSRFANGSPPDVTFARAARSGLGLALETATMRAAFEAATVLPAGAYLSVNASPELIRSGEMAAILRGSDRPIALEITEHVAIDDYDAVRADLAALGPGVRVAVDDAGAGYASLRHILELAPDIVKLDIGLIRHINADPARQALVAGMSYFAVKRKIRLVAEGVETTAELDALRSLGISYGQGYLFGRPEDARGPGPWPSNVAIPHGRARGRKDQSTPRALRASAAAIGGAGGASPGARPHAADRARRSRAKR
jgi:PAS domain S-box-containing protein